MGELVATKTYITGAHGSRHRDEAFGDPYELPPDRAYAETCARSRASSGTGGCCWPRAAARYADEMERVLYNGVAAGDVARRATASSTPTRCNCAPATTAPTRTSRQGA